METRTLESLNLNLDYKDKKLFVETVKNKTSTEKNAEEIIDDFKNNALRAVSKPLYQGEKTNSELFNRQFEDVLTDLIKLFTLANKTSSLISSNNYLYDSFIESLKNNLKKIENKIEAYSYIANNDEGFAEVKFENFNNKESFEEMNDETKMLFANPKDDKIFSSDFIAEINKYSDSLTLSPIGKIAPEAPLVEMDNQVGKYLKVENGLYPLENIIKNDNPENVWSESILTDRPFEVEMEEEKEGAVFKFRIIFEKPMPINNISIDPFSKFPLKIIKINTYQNAEDYMKGEEFAYPILSDSYESFFDPKYVDDAETLEFSTRNIQVVEFVVNQEHYEYEQFSIKESDKNDINIAEKMYESKHTVLNLEESSNESLLELDYSNNSILWNYLKDMVGNFFKELDVNNKNKVIGNILNSVNSIIPELSSKKFNPLSDSTAKEKEKIVSMNKYSYQYGFKNIEPSYKEYLDRAIYVSKPYNFITNIKEVAIEIDDVNQKLYHEDSEEFSTSVEYYITNLKNPSPRRATWYPILPINYDYKDINGNPKIKSERLFSLDGEDFKAKIRFPAKPETIEVFKDGVEIDSDEIIYSEVSSQNSLLTDNIVTLTNELNSIYNNSIYTINYTVKDGFDPTILDLEDSVPPVDFIDSDGNEGELFNISDYSDNRIRLKYHPFIDKDKLYSSPAVDIKESSTDKNPFYGSYSPNYHKCYRPIEVSGFGKLSYSDGSEIKEEEINVDQDLSGIPYRFPYFKDTNGDGVVESFEYKKDSKPYFFNKTDYRSRGSLPFSQGLQVPLIEYSAYDYPIIDYFHDDKNIIFSHSLEDGSKKSEIRVKYQYLTECLRVKVVMYRNVKHQNGITPVVKNYAVKVKPFK